MLISLGAMLLFRRSHKFKVSEASSIMNDYNRLKTKGLRVIWLSGIIILGMVYVILSNSYPDLIAVYNPFKSQLGIRNIDKYRSFGIIASALVMVLVLVHNSLWFTGPSSTPAMRVQQFSKVSFSLNLLNADYFSGLATFLPIVTFFGIIWFAYEFGNAFGISLFYLGLITIFQLIQFFQNFKNLHFYYLGIIMSGKVAGDEVSTVEKSQNDNFSEIMKLCRFYGKFSSGVTLFIHIAMCFTILVDSFNMHVVDEISLIDPYSLIAILCGVFGMYLLVSLDLACVSKFVKYFIHRLNMFTVEKLNIEGYEPDLRETASDLIRLSFMNQLLFLIIPV